MSSVIKSFFAPLVLLFASAGVLAPPAPAATDFGFKSFDAMTLGEDAQPVTQAAAHPFAGIARISLNDDGLSFSPNRPKEIRVELPPGFIGNPQAVGQCESPVLDGMGSCPPSSQIGLIATDPFGPETRGIYNIEPPRGIPAQFGFSIFAIPTVVTASIRPYDYGITLTARNITTTVPFHISDAMLWGVPAAGVHDPYREPAILGQCSSANLTYPPFAGTSCWSGTPSGTTPRPFISNPSDCSAGPLKVTAFATSWLRPGDVKTISVLSHDNAMPPNPIGLTGCDKVPFSPSLKAVATADSADSPTGMEITVHLPQSEDPEGLATAYLKRAVVDLPHGVSVNPASAAGLGACSPGEIGLTTAVGGGSPHFDGSRPACPESSRIGSVEVATPVLDHPLPGSLYLAEPGDNPFGSLLAVYLVIDDAQSGVRVKLAGKVETDSNNGQLRAIFDESPQLPFEDLKVSLFEGPRAALRTALACGTFTTTSEMTPWTAPEGETMRSSDSFSIERAAAGSCPPAESQAPNRPSFSAGTVAPAAAAFSPFVLKLSREDGSQPIKGIDTTLPKGLLAKLAGIPYCPDAALAAAAARSGRAEQGSPSCPSASEIGSVDVGAGAGPTPLHVAGRVYLAGPYKGAPLSLAVLTPAVAGPFDLGTVLTRVALQVNPETAQVHAVSDPIPTILQGIPLDIRSVALKLDRDQFTLNPTSCDPMAIEGSALSVFDQTAALADRFQVGGCQGLGFKPRLELKLRGGTRRGKFPALRADLRARPGQANIGRVSVALPHSEFLAQSHIRTICTRVQYLAESCPKGSIYGRARAFTPLLERPLEGPVYLRSSSHPLPDLVVALRGQIDVELVGRIDSVNGGIRSTFEGVPDAPVSRFVLTMQGGRKGLLENSRNLCATTNRATVKMDGQNGKVHDFRPVLKVHCGKGRTAGKRGSANHGRG